MSGFGPIIRLLNDNTQRKTLADKYMGRNLHLAGKSVSRVFSRPAIPPVDAQNPNLVALVRGPMALFAVGSPPAKTTRAQLLGAAAASQFC